MRLDKYLCDMQMGTRSELKKIIRSGRVTVNQEHVKDPGTNVTETDLIEFDGKPVRYEKNMTYLFHKPGDCVTAKKDSMHKTVMDYFPPELQILNPVGRLDFDTEGLLFLTTDGELLHHLISPSHRVEKTYYAILDTAVPPEAVSAFADGIDIGDDTPTLPARLEIVSDSKPYAANLTICEGRFHQVKRMFAAIGCKVTYLKRIREGAFTLEQLKRGEYRKLTEEEIALLKAKSYEKN
ncbi:MAG: rRNA pseudouridine synthase [Agathobacter sp.]|uniref:pseudouridine synthase n=1 Tax=Agathobacter sp. TaxID=2021311 RepID=UPI00257C6369|nr:pseudouridine synthase [Agathobacter sp.]MBQ1680762.1 rRNA pseudouridine synthase [Agathobacter sp.]